MSARVLFVSLALLLASCETVSKSLGKSEPDPSWRESEVASPSDRVLWKLSLLAVQKRNFPLGGGLDPSSGTITSGWQTHLAPFGRQGYRIKAEVEMEPLEPGHWAVRTRVAKQINKTMVAPLDPTRADWEWVPDDTIEADILLHQIASAFDPDLELEDPGDSLDKYLERVDAAREQEEGTQPR